jgi:hypothetical protein
LPGRTEGKREGARTTSKAHTCLRGAPHDRCAGGRAAGVGEGRGGEGNAGAWEAVAFCQEWRAALLSGDWRRCWRVTHLTASSTLFSLAPHPLRFVHCRLLRLHHPVLQQQRKSIRRLLV